MCIALLYIYKYSIKSDQIFLMQGKDKIEELFIQCDNFKKLVEIKQKELVDAKFAHQQLEEKREGEMELKRQLEKDFNKEKEQVSFLEKKLNNVLGEKAQVCLNTESYSVLF